MSFLIEGGSEAELYWKNLRKKIESKAIGRELLKAMDMSPHACTVMFVDDSVVVNDGGAVAGPANPERDKVPGVAIVKHFAPKEAVLTAFARSRFAMEIAQGWRYYFRVHGNKNPLLAAAVRASGLSPDVIARRLKTHGVIGNELGTISAKTVEDYMNKPTVIPEEILWRLIWLLKPYLEPGTGAPTRIRIARSIGLETTQKKSSFFWRPQWDPSPFEDGHIICVHELIHAYRVMQGTRIVDGGWEEEAMTMGLAPFQGEHFTENKYRRAWLKKKVDRHGSMTFSSNTMQIQCKYCSTHGRGDGIFYP